ncbi:hypothetical protein [Aestuariivirga sp.]|uniref:hypothetical protein n=1 Tax=Aestuariivirga sp. TaxID=2650926 RepID=UPI003018BC19
MATTTDSCIVTFSATASAGTGTLADAFVMVTNKTTTALPYTQVFYTTGYTAGASVTFQLLYRSTNTSACKLNKATLVVMSP